MGCRTKGKAGTGMCALKKSVIHFAKLLEDRQFSDIARISKYYFMDQVVRRGLIGGISLFGRLIPPKQLHACPACGKKFPYFLPVVAGEHLAFSVQCPYCKSYERHRSQWLYYERETDLLHPKRSISILHCAPEQLFFEHLEAEALVDYYPVDKWTGYTVCGKQMRDYVDLTDLPYQDYQFDYILCNHVLEHIPNERQALSELRRTLKTDGIAFINVPVDGTLPETLEDPSYNTDALRLKYYGQCDHFRKYGMDFPERLREAGFSVMCVVVGEYFSNDEICLYGLSPQEQIYSCRKQESGIEREAIL